MVSSSDDNNFEDGDEFENDGELETTWGGVELRRGSGSSATE